MQSPGCSLRPKCVRTLAKTLAIIFDAVLAPSVVDPGEPGWWRDELRSETSVRPTIELILHNPIITNDLGADWPARQGRLPRFICGRSDQRPPVQAASKHPLVQQPRAISVR